MRKRDIPRIKEGFSKAIDAIVDVLTRSKTLPNKVRNLLTESSFLAAAVMWEGFVHELFVAHINHDSAKFRSFLTSSIQQSVKEKRGEFVSLAVRLEMKTHLTISVINNIIDKESKNISFKTADDMVARATEWLSRSSSKTFRELSHVERAAINMWHAVRNYLAHRSSASIVAMNDALDPNTKFYKGLRRGKHRIRDVGSFLNATPQQGSKCRIISVLSIMRRIGMRL